jgi:hypothetical protein
MNVRDAGNEPVKLEISQRLFFGLLAIDVCVSAVMTLYAFSLLETLRKIAEGVIPVNQSMIDRFDFLGNLNGVWVLTSISVGIGLVRWLSACYAYAERVLGVSELNNAGWTTWGWIIPIFNLFKPYQVISDLYKVGGTGYTSPDGWKNESGSGALLAWWLFYIVTHGIMLAINRIAVSSDLREIETIKSAQIGNFLETTIFLGLISLALSGMWFWVCRLLTQRLLGRGPVATDKSPPSLTPKTPSPASSSIQSPSTRLNQPEPQKMINDINAADPDQIDGEKACLISMIDEDMIYELVGKEIQEGRPETGLWTRIFAEMDGDETKTKVAYIKRRVHNLIVIEKNHIKQQLQREEEEKSAHRTAVVEFLRSTKSVGITLKQAREMSWFGITVDGDKFVFEGRRYGRIEDAMNQAKTQYGRLSQDQNPDSSLKESR